MGGRGWRTILGKWRQKCPLSTSKIPVHQLPLAPLLDNKHWHPSFPRRAPPHSHCHSVSQPQCTYFMLCLLLSPMNIGSVGQMWWPQLNWLGTQTQKASPSPQRSPITFRLVTVQNLWWLPISFKVKIWRAGRGAVFLHQSSLFQEPWLLHCLTLLHWTYTKSWRLPCFP